MSNKEQKNCCGTTCNKKEVSEYIDELEARSVDAMLEHFKHMVDKTKCKVLTIASIKKWAGIKEEE